MGHHDWINFEISDQIEIDLFVRGYFAAASLLKSFNWASFKKIRAEMNISSYYFNNQPG